MKHWIKIVFAMLIFICFSCYYQGENYENLTRKVIKQTGKKLQREKGLSLVDAGGIVTGRSHVMTMSFTFKHLLTIDAARPLLLYAVEEYLAAFNNNEKLQPYLNNYPLTPKNIIIFISLHEKNSSFIEPGKINFAKASEGMFTYSIEDLKTKQLKNVYVETFEEALQICRKQENAPLLKTLNTQREFWIKSKKHLKNFEE